MLLCRRTLLAVIVCLPFMVDSVHAQFRLPDTQPVSGTRTGGAWSGYEPQGDPSSWNSLSAAAASLPDSDSALYEYRWAQAGPLGAAGLDDVDLPGNVALTDYVALPEYVTLPDEIESYSGSLLPPDEVLYHERKLSKQKAGLLQRISLTASWLPQDQPSDLGLTEVEVLATIGLPAPTRDSPLLITTGFETRFLDGPVTPALPPRLHDAYVEFRWLKKVRPRWGIDLAVSPGVYSDFEKWDDDALRIKGRALASFEWTPRLKLITGIVYLDRSDVSLLPAAGVIWTPHPDARYELVFPRPRVARRIYCEESLEDWIYIAGEFGGGSWSIEQVPGVQDVVTIRDIRLILGLERVREGGGGRRIEVAYVTGREVEFDSALPSFEPDDTIMLRGGWTY